MTTRRAHWVVCPDCRAVVLRGLDADVCALDATVDPVRLTREQELACVVIGRPVYDLEQDRQLWRRSPAAVVHGPCYRPVPAHDCGRPVRAPAVTERTERPPLPIEPPF